MSQPETNELQRLIAAHIAATPGENYATIARRARMSRSTVFALATRPRMRQTPHPDTIAALARGMQMPESRVRVAAGLAAGFGGSPREVWVALVRDELDASLAIYGVASSKDRAMELCREEHPDRQIEWREAPDSDGLDGGDAFEGVAPGSGITLVVERWGVA